MKTLKISIPKEQFEAIQNGKGKLNLWLTKENVSLLFNYADYPGIQIGDSTVKTTRERFIKILKNPETVGEAMKYLKTFEDIQVSSWTSKTKRFIKGIAIMQNPETGNFYFCIGLY